MSLAATLTSRMALMVCGRLFLLIMSLLTTAIMTRSLGPSGFGDYRTAIAFLGMAIALSEMGMVTIFMRELGGGDIPHEKLVANTFGLRLCFSCAALLIAVGIGWLMPFERGARLGIVIGAAGFVAYSMHLLLFGLFQQRLKQYGAVFAEVGGGMILLAGCIAVAAFNGNAETFVATLAVSYVMTFGLSVYFARRLVRIAIEFDAALWRKLVMAMLPLGAVATLTIAYYRADTIMLALLQPSAAVGLYGVPVKVTDSVLGIALLFTGMMVPLLSAAAKQSPTRFAELLTQGLGILTIGSVCVAVGLAALAPEIIGILAGPSFAAAAVILVILSMVAVLHVVTLLLRDAATVLSLQHRLLPAYGLGATVAFAAYILLIPRFAGAGAAMALVAAELTVFTGVVIILRRAGKVVFGLGVPIRAALCGLGSVALVLVLQEYQWHWFLRGAVGGLSYLTLLVLTSTLHISDVKQLYADLKRPKATSA